MERHRLRNILTLVLFSCDLLVTQEIIYKTLGTTVELVCPIANTTRPITWFGPLNYKIYAVGMDVSQDVSTQVDINETEADKKSILLIHRFTKEKSGKYKCSNFDDKRDFTLIIKNPPSVKLLNHTFSSFDIQRNIQCIANGNPMEYTYGKWEHKSFFNEHVRYLNGTSSGLLILPLQEKRVRYQDSGIYVCSVSNGVPDENGNYFQKEYSYVFSKGPPVFVMNNKRIQYGNIGKPMDLMVYVQSWLNITNHSVATAVREIQHLKVAIYHIKIKDTFHGQLIQLFGWKVVFSFHKSTIDQFQNYTITISNEVGSADYVTELKSKGKYETVETSISVQSIVIISLGIIIAVLVAGIVIYVRRLKLKYKERIEPAINIQTPEGNFGESAHYTEIVEIDNLQPTSQGNPSDLVIVNATDNKITAVQGTEHNIECRVTSGQPGGNITWSAEGAIVAKAEPNLVRNRSKPQRSNNGKLFKCEAFISEGDNILESSVHLKVFYIPKIRFSPDKKITVKESEETQLICINDGNDPDATTVRKRQPTNIIITQNDKLNFKRINRTDAGLYTCRVDTKAGVYEDNATVDVQYAPAIEIRYSPYERKMKCIPRGVPDKYMFKDREHKTEYNDQIRFLATTKEGNVATLTFPSNVTGKNDHHDRGIYICRASNNISSSDGIFVMRKYNFKFEK